MALPIPKNVEELSAEWIQEVLQAAGVLAGQQITNVHHRVIGDSKGFLSCTVAAGLDYAGPAGDAPTSVVVKMETERERFREAGRELGAFEREVRFYREVADRVAMRLAGVYHAESTPEGSVLVMEDLSRLQGGDQIHGLRHDQVVSGVQEIAKLHAAFWNNSALHALDWVPVHDPFWIQDYAEHWPAFAREYELRIGQEGLRIGEGLVRHERLIRERIAERPMTLVHSDLRADNMLFGDAQSSEAALILDWQLITKSLGAIDPTRLLGGSEPAAERQGHHLEVFTAWYKALLEAGVTSYEYEEALQDFRLGALYNLTIPIKSHAFLSEVETARAGRLMDAQAQRFFVSAHELDVGAILP